MTHGEPIRRGSLCPVCTRELPAPPGQCEVCGFAYDERTRVWRSTASWSPLAYRYIVVGFLLGLLLALVYQGGSKRTVYATFPLLMAVVLPGIVLLVRRVFGGRMSGRFVAVTPAGIVVGTRPRPLTVPWGDFERFREQRGVLTIQRHGDAPPVALEEVFSTPEAASAFRKIVGEFAAASRCSTGGTDDGA